MEKEIILCFRLEKKSEEKLNKKFNQWDTFKNTWLGQYFLSRFYFIRKKSVTTTKKVLRCRKYLAGTEVYTWILPVTSEMLRTNSYVQKRTRQYIESAKRQHNNRSICAIFYQEELEEILSLHNEVGSALMVGIVKEVMGTWNGIEEVQLVDNERDAFPILDEIYPVLNRLTIFTEEQERYEQFAANVFEETGLLVNCQEMVQNGLVLKGTPMIIDLCPNMKIPCGNIVHGTVYVDLCPNRFKKRKIELKCKDVNYVNYWNFLDSY